jgi:hypothetical protein
MRRQSAFRDLLTGLIADSARNDFCNFCVVALRGSWDLPPAGKAILYAQDIYLSF